MSTLEYSEILGRMIRKDEPGRLGVGTWDLLRDVIRTNNKTEALALVDYLSDLELQKDQGTVIFYDRLFQSIAKLGGEAQVFRAWYNYLFPRVKRWLSEPTTALEALQRCTELQRGHHGVFSISEDQEKYTVTYDPCGSGGKLRRNVNDIGKTKQAYYWTWGKPNVPYYCVHCAVQWEIIPIELRGYPIKVTLFDEDPHKPCTHLFYKKPESIPRVYYTRLAKIPPAK